jgi:hypothetical protein
MYVMKGIVVVFLFSAFFFCCNGQDKNKQKPKDVNKETAVGSNPKVSVKVNKKYDSKGNLVRFDSTYSYSYSSRGRDSALVSMDTLFRNFKSRFPHNWDTEFRDIFMTDSLAQYDFLNRDYFSKRLELNMERIRNRFREMDSIKNRYLRDSDNIKK